MIVIYDPGKRAPASEGNVPGMFSLGCVMENMWLMAQSPGIGLMIMSVFSGEHVEKELKRVLKIPECMRIAFAVRLGYPVADSKCLRVRQDIDAFTHYNGYGKKGIN